MRRVLRYLEIPALIAVPVVLGLCAALQVRETAVLTLVVVSAALVIFFASFEAGKPALRQIMPTVVLAALAASGRMLFWAVPNFKPVSAICIVAGVVFGRRAGFMVGALAAFVSNFFFGQGPWTPWQMYAWGMIGYFAGVLANHLSMDSLTNRVVLYMYGFSSAFLFGILLNTYYLIGFIQPLTWQTATIAYGASFIFDVTHGIATVSFLALIYAPWRKKLERIKLKYALDT